MRIRKGNAKTDSYVMKVWAVGDGAHMVTLAEVDRCPAACDQPLDLHDPPPEERHPDHRPRRAPAERVSFGSVAPVACPVCSTHVRLALGMRLLDSV